MENLVPGKDYTFAETAVHDTNSNIFRVVEQRLIEISIFLSYWNKGIKSDAGDFYAGRSNWQGLRYPMEHGRFSRWRFYFP